MRRLVLDQSTVQSHLVVQEGIRVLAVGQCAQAKGLGTDVQRRRLGDRLGDVGLMQSEYEQSLLGGSRNKIERCNWVLSLIPMDLVRLLSNETLAPNLERHFWRFKP